MQFDPTAPPNLALLAAESGVDPQRIAWSTFFSKDIEFLVKGLADIFLDTPNFNAHTTGVDALWSNTPILTTPGGEFSARVAAGLVTAVSPLQVLSTRVALLALVSCCEHATRCRFHPDLYLPFSA
jgi:predicted O-linked N-acetylglucosamine transferase (SPINDLY family)